MAKAKFIYGPQESEDGKSVTFKSVSYPCSSYDNIYDKAMSIMWDYGDREYVHHIATEVASWCELASVGEVYEDGPLTVVIEE